MVLKSKDNTKLLFDPENSHCQEWEDISLIISKKKYHVKKRRKYKINKNYSVPYRSLQTNPSRGLMIPSIIRKCHSMPVCSKLRKTKFGASVKTKICNNFGCHMSTFRKISEQRFPSKYKPFKAIKLEVYRCQLNTQDESCCCSCNSDAMFEVMKSLYDCYKKKNCDNCNCILCAHLPKEERQRGELRKASVLGGKTHAEKEKILRELAMKGLALPEARTASDKSIINKVRKDLGLPPEPKTESEKKKYDEAVAAGVIIPLEGKTPDEKEKILKRLHEMGIELPEARTPSEKALIKKIKETGAKPSEFEKPKDKMQAAKAAGLLTPLEGKTTEQRKEILKGLAMLGIPLPEGKTPSLKDLIEKVRDELGLPPAPKNDLEKQNYDKAYAAGVIVPLEGKTPEEKAHIIRRQIEMGVNPPKGRTESEREMIKNILDEMKRPKKGKSKGVTAMLSPEKRQSLDKKSAKVMKEGKGPSDECICDILLPPSERIRSAGLLPDRDIINKLRSERPSLQKVPSAKIRNAIAAGLMTPLTGKSPEQKKNIIRGLAKAGIPLPEGKTASEKELVKKVIAEMGLPPRPRTKSIKSKYDKALADGLITPLEGKKMAEKEKILRRQAALGLPLPEGRTPSEKALINKIKAEKSPPRISGVSAARLRKAQEAGLLTPLQGKTAEQKKKILKGLVKAHMPLPVGRTASEKALINQVRNELGLPPEPDTPLLKEKYKKALKDGIITPLEGKSTPEKEKILRRQAQMGLKLPEGRTKSEKALINKIKAEMSPRISGVSAGRIQKAQEAGLLTPLQGKTAEQKKKILKGLVKAHMPLPVGKTPSEKALINQVRNELGLPPEPDTPSLKEKYKKALKDGIITPLEGKSTPEKEKILRKQAQMGLKLPEGRTKSEKALINKIKAEMSPRISGVSAGRVQKAQEAGLLTPLQGKTAEQKKKILKGLVKAHMPLPVGKTPSEKALINQVRNELGLPPEPDTPSLKEKYKKALKDGIITPLEGKSTPEKEKILRKQAQMGLKLPEGRTKSEKALINKIKAEMSPRISGVSAGRVQKAQEAGLLTPLQGKTAEQKKKILKGLVKAHMPLPVGKTPSEKALINQVRNELGLPPEPDTPSLKEKYKKALKDGIITPLEGKSTPEKEKILRKQAQMGLKLPEGRTKSEKALINKIKAEMSPRISGVSAGRIQKAQEAGLLTPLQGKTTEQKKKILKGLVQAHLPLPIGKTASEKALINQVRNELGLPPEPDTKSLKEKHKKALKDGIITPLEGKSTPEKEKILRKQAQMGLKLPEGRTKSEKALINKIKAEMSPRISGVSAGRLRKAQEAGLLTPLAGKTAEEKKKILRGLVKAHMPLPIGKTASEKALIKQVSDELGLPIIEPDTKSLKEKYRKALKDGVITPLEGKTAAEKEQILKKLQREGIPLPKGRTPSEKALIDKIKGMKKSSRPRKKGRPALSPEFNIELDRKTAKVMIEGKGPSDECICDLLTPESERSRRESEISKDELLRKARASGVLTTASGKHRKEKKIKTKSKKIGSTASKRTTKKLQYGMTEELEDITKTTKCDRACGCDKKKIKFKHSYVKIRVTSPDLSNLCPCPEECVPGVKHGVITDNEGIKVTVGTALFYPYSKETLEDLILNNTSTASGLCTSANSDTPTSSFDSELAKSDISKLRLIRDILGSSINQSDNVTSEDGSSYCYSNTKNYLSYIYLNKNIHSISMISQPEVGVTDYEMITDDDGPSRGSFEQSESASLHSDEEAEVIYSSTDTGSYDSIILVETESSLGLGSECDYSSNSLGVVTFLKSSISENSLCTDMWHETKGNIVSQNLPSKGSSSHFHRDGNMYHLFSSSSYETTKDDPKCHAIRSMYSLTERESLFTPYNRKGTREVYIYRVSLSDGELCVNNSFHGNFGKELYKSNGALSRDVLYIVEDMLSHNDLTATSMMFVLTPNSEVIGLASDDDCSKIYVAFSEHSTKWISHHTNLNLQQNIDVNKTDVNITPEGNNNILVDALNHAQISGNVCIEQIKLEKLGKIDMISSLVSLKKSITRLKPEKKHPKPQNKSPESAGKGSEKQGKIGIISSLGSLKKSISRLKPEKKLPKPQNKSPESAGISAETYKKINEIDKNNLKSQVKNVETKRKLHIIISRPQIRTRFVTQKEKEISQPLNQNIAGRKGNMSPENRQEQRTADSFQQQCRQPTPLKPCKTISTDTTERPCGCTRNKSAIIRVACTNQTDIPTIIETLTSDTNDQRLRLPKYTDQSGNDAASLCMCTPSPCKVSAATAAALCDRSQLLKKNYHSCTDLGQEVSERHINTCWKCNSNMTQDKLCSNANESRQPCAIRISPTPVSQRNECLCRILVCTPRESFTQCLANNQLQPSLKELEPQEGRCTCGNIGKELEKNKCLCSGTNIARKVAPLLASQSAASVFKSSCKCVKGVIEEVCSKKTLETQNVLSCPCSGTERTKMQISTSQLIPPQNQKACQCDKRNLLKKTKKSSKVRMKKIKVVECECPLVTNKNSNKCMDTKCKERCMKSDLTQQTSCVRVKKKSKGSGSSLNDSLFDTFIELLEEKEKQNKGQLQRSVKNKKSNSLGKSSGQTLQKGFICECPYVPSPPCNEPKGIKFSIEGKGSMSKGLSGFLWFD